MLQYIVKECAWSVEYYFRNYDTGHNDGPILATVTEGFETNTTKENHTERIIYRKKPMSTIHEQNNVMTNLYKDPH